MLDQVSREIVGYWEKRRYIYNLLLFPAAWFGWQVSSEFTYAIDDHYPAYVGDPRVIGSAFYLLIMANVCYSIVYLVEVALLSDRKRKWWPVPGRTLLLVCGCLLGMLLATSNAFHLQTRERGEWIRYNQPSGEKTP